MTDALVTAPTLTASDISGRMSYSHHEAVAAVSVIVYVTTLFLFLFLSINILRSAKLIPTHSIQKLYQW